MDTMGYMKEQETKDLGSINSINQGSEGETKNKAEKNLSRSQTKENQDTTISTSSMVGRKESDKEVVQDGKKNKLARKSVNEVKRKPCKWISDHGKEGACLKIEEGFDKVVKVVCQNIKNLIQRHPSKTVEPTPKHSSTSSKTLIPIGPITGAKAKRLQIEVETFLSF
ncbi:hypothetical protein VNO77_43858 [Canavalia gladiata]|uniref:Uncharacterized protein n=1 Tax=Canavalia gladiata TaxID=3824 RepID=A0AAN9PN98_CANGL